MRRRWNKPVAILATLAMAGSLLAGCGSSKETTSGESAAAPAETTAEAGGEEAAAPVEAEEVSYPLAEGGSLTYWLQLNPNVSANFTNLGDTELGKSWIANTGVDIEFQHPASGQESEQFNLIVADGNFPDIMEWQWVNNYPGGPEKAIDDGVIIALNDVIDQYCPNLKK